MNDKKGMKMKIKENFYYDSSDGRTKIHACMWLPAGGESGQTGVKGVVQIVHGMVEFIDRYDRFASFLAENGFCVVGNDHLGHGESVASEQDYGYFGEPNGNIFVIRDMRRLYRIVRSRYPEAPYILLGHSMGSFLVRQYINMYGIEVDGAIIMGTGYQSFGTLRTAMSLCRSIAFIHGWRYRSRLLTKMAMGSYNKRIHPTRTKNDWLTKDTEIVDAYNANPWNNFTFTVNAYYSMFRGIAAAQKDENLRRLRKDLPILLVSGAEDPVGDYGEGVRKVYDEYLRTGMTDVRMKLYPDDRHEILNELNYKDVYEEILQWLKEQVEAHPDEPADDEPTDETD